MLSRIIDDYKKNLPKEIPAAILKSGAASASLSFLWGESEEEIFRRAMSSMILVAFDSCVSAPIAGAVFSDKSIVYKDLATRAISILGITSFSGLTNQRLSREILSSSFGLTVILNALGKPGYAITVIC